MCHVAFAPLAYWAFHVLGQTQHFNQIDELFFGDRIVVNAKCHQKGPRLLLIAAALKIHCRL